MSLNFHVSNRLDLLATALAEVTSECLGSVFTTETVVVQSLATRAWLKLRLAEASGIFANYEFPFLAELIARCVKTGKSDESAAGRSSIELLTWRIESALRRCTEKKEYAAVARYLADGDSLKRFALAGRLANLFDQYRLYRPDVLVEWSAGRKKRRGHEEWQSKLWLEVDGSSDFDRAIAAMRASGFKQSIGSDFPARVSIFAPTSLPPAYVDLLFQLGQVRAVHLFLLRPSIVYHGADLTPKLLAKASTEQSPSDSGNPLLASWGRMDAELTDLLIDAEDRLGIAPQVADERFHEVERTNLLTTLQHDIFAGNNRGAEGSEPKLAVQPNDDSLCLHSCHSPMREVEVLYDQLLDCFERYPDLRPRDILVMTPEIEKYAPLVRAVFGYPEDDSIRIPYLIADRHPRSESVAIDTFLTLIGLADSRYTAPEIFALLSSRTLRRRFGLTEEDLALIRHWIEATAIRWGIDAHHRSTKGVPAVAANTWRQGLNRLLLGFAMPGKDKLLFAGILPQDDVEGDGAETLGRFLTAVEALLDIAVTFESPRPLAGWAEPLQHILNTFLMPGDENDLRDLRHLRATIEGLGALSETARAEEAVDFRAVRQFLETQLGAMEQRGSFFKGGVTFCALKPVRSIPAEVICLLGVNAQVFPRRPQVAQFDLMADRRPGDPSPAADDRFAFLETVLSARRRLLITYVGRSVQDNKKLPPSVLISELIDYAQQAFTFPDNNSAEEFFTVNHPLHAFSRDYFAATRPDQRLFSYSNSNAEAARTIESTEASATAPFIIGAIPEATLENSDIELSDLIRFWRNPAEYFVRWRIGVELPDSEEGLPSEEPFELKAREQYPIKQELLADKLGFCKAASSQVFAARGTLPPGMMGELQLRTIDAEVEQFAQAVRRRLAAGTKDDPKEIKLVFDDFTLGGRIHSLYGGAALHFRCAKLKAADQLRAWIEHLALCASAEDDKSKTTLIGTDGAVIFGHVPNAAELLEALCVLYRKGATYPLPFFPATAIAYITAELNNRDSIKSAGQQWHGLWNKRGEKDDRFIACCFNTIDPLDEQFVHLAHEVCTPLLTYAKAEALNE